MMISRCLILALVVVLAQPLEARPLLWGELTVPNSQTAVAIAAVVLPVLIGKEHYAQIIKDSPLVNGSPLEANANGDVWLVTPRASTEPQKRDGDTAVVFPFRASFTLTISSHDGRVLDLAMLRQ